MNYLKSTGLFHEALVQNKGIISVPDTVFQTQFHYSRHKKAQNVPKTYLQIFSNHVFFSYLQ